MALLVFYSDVQPGGEIEINYLNAAQPGVENGLSSSRLDRKVRLGFFYFPLNLVF